MISFKVDLSYLSLRFSYAVLIAYFLESTLKKDLIVTQTSLIKPKDCIFSKSKQGMYYLAFTKTMIICIISIFHFLFLVLNESGFEVEKGLNDTKEEQKTLILRSRPFANFFIPISNRTSPFKGNIRTATTNTTNSMKGLIAGGQYFCTFFTIFLYLFVCTTCSKML